MADPYLEELEEELRRQGDSPCLWRAIQNVHGLALSEAQTPDMAYSLLCTLNNGLRKGFWRVVVNKPGGVTHAEIAREIAAKYIDPEGFAEKIVYDPGDENSQLDIRYLIDQHAAAITAALDTARREALAEAANHLESVSADEGARGDESSTNEWRKCTNYAALTLRQEADAIRALQEKP